MAGVTTNRLILTRQMQMSSSPDGWYWLVYQTNLDSGSYERIDNWGEFKGVIEGRRWIRSQYWPGTVEIVEH